MDSSPRPNRRGFVIVVTAAGTWLADCALTLADDFLSLRKARRRVTPLCSVPNADYQHGARTPSVLIRSLPAIPQLSVDDVKLALDAVSEQARGVAVPTSPLSEKNTQEAMRRATQPKAKLMQLATRDVQIAHCSLSDVALLIEPSGVWHLGLRGDQNFLRDDRRNERNDDLQLKRNAFNVTMRLLRSSRSGGESNVDQAGKLAYTEIKIPEFWVQREAPQLITRTGHNSTIAYYYDDINQVEYEFFVRLDPLTGSGAGVVQPWQPQP